MIVGIDAKELAKGKAGIALYISSMLDWFHKLDDKNEYILFSSKDFEMKPNWTRCKKVIYKKYTTGSIKVALGLKKSIEDNNVDVFWGPEHCIPLNVKNIKKIVTIHDIAVVLHPEWGTNYNSILQRFLIAASLNVSDRVIAISNSTKNDLIKRYSIDENKIKVIYNGDSQYNYGLRDYSLEQEKEIRDKYSIQSKYFFYCGTIEPRKNIISIVKAFEKYNDALNNEYKLVISGGLGWKYEPIMECINQSKAADKIVITGYVTEEEKEYLYRNAEAFLFPSFYEGFGFPILEAMSVGSLVITAHNSSLIEVGGNEAFFVDKADNINQLKDYMIEITNMSEDEKKKRKEKSIIWAKRFSRKDCAKELLGEFDILYKGLQDDDKFE